jgi:peptidoglycan/LPS O-acetylase OafA/YrhL
MPLPWVTFGAVGFYLVLAAMAVSSDFRERILLLFDLAAAPARPHYPFLDALRGIAALWVAAFHTWQWLWGHPILFSGILGQGHKAVPLFFVLSGFLLYRGLVRDRITAPVIGAYFRRRALRIYPLYLSTVIAFSLLRVYRGGRLPLSGFLGEVFLKGIIDPKCFTNPPAWTLFLEISFYIALPFWILSTRRFPRALSLAGLALGTLTSFSSLPALHSHPYELVKCFFAGMLAAEISRRPAFAALTEGPALSLFLAGAVIIGFDLAGTDICAWAIVHGLRVLGMRISLITNDFFSLGQAVGFSLIVLAGTASRWLGRLGSFTVFRFLGTISYSLFLWHPLIILLDSPIALTGVQGGMIHPPDFHPTGSFLLLTGLYLPADFLLASVSYACIERPFLR